MRTSSLFLVMVAGLLVAAAANAQDCAAGSNQLTNGCFTVEPLAGWTYTAGTGNTETTICGTSCNANRVVGALGIRLRQCLGALAAGTYGFGFSARAANADIDSCTATISTYTDGSCSSGEAIINSVGISTFTETAYDSASANAILSGAGYSSVRYQLECPVFGGGTFTARLDDAFFGVGLAPVELLSFGVE